MTAVASAANLAAQVHSRIGGTRVNLRRAVCTLTVPINGAEELGLAKAASDLGVTMQSFILSRCGVQLWRLAAPARVTHRQPVRKALKRRSVTIFLGTEDQATLQALAGVYWEKRGQCANRLLLQ